MNIVVTGGSRGIGKAIVEQLAAVGNRVVFNYQSSAAEAETIVAAIRERGGEAWAFQADISDFDQAAAFLTSAQTALGGEVDALINNAGITRDNVLFMMTQKEWTDVININLNGYFNVTRNLITSFMKRKSGSIVNITSISGHTGVAGQTNYSASKAGIIGFTRSLAKETARAGVTINAVAPGFIETDMTGKMSEEQIKELRKGIPMRRFGSPKDVADMVEFLISEKSRYITGQVFTVDGGLTA